MSTKPALPIIAINVFSFLSDLGALLLAYAISPLIIAYFNDSTVFSFWDYNSVDVITYTLGACFVAILCLTGHYTKRAPWWNQILSVIKIITIMLAIDIIARSTADIGNLSSFPIVYWITAFLFIVVSRYFLYVIKTKVTAYKIPVVIIGDDRTCTDILYALSSDLSVGYDPKYILMRGDESRRFEKNEAPPIFRDIKVTNGRENYADFIKNNLDHHYIISMDTFRGDDRDDLLVLLNNEDVTFSLVPMISQMSLYQTQPLYFFGNDVMLIETKRYKLNFIERTIKRTFDIIAATLGLTMLAIPFLIIAIRLKIETPNEPVLYSGQRVGKDKKRFRCWKYRTMESNADHVLEKFLSENPDEKIYWERFLKLRNDPRVTTKTTKFIRKTSIDELPQLWNVLRGEMSIVGPRPILPNELDLYGEPIKYYASVKPGITGLWQVSGRSETSFNRRIVWDRWYIRNWSYWGDIVIIIKTILVVFTGKGAA